MGDKAFENLIERDLYDLLKKYIDLENLSFEIEDFYCFKDILLLIQEKIKKIYNFENELYLVALSVILNEIRYKYSQIEIGLDSYNTKLMMYSEVDQVLRLARSVEKGVLNIERLSVKLRRESKTIDQSSIPNSIIYNSIQNSKDHIPDNLSISNDFFLSIILKDLPSKIKELEEYKSNARQSVFDVSNNIKTPKVEVIKQYILPLQSFVSSYCTFRTKDQRNVLIAKFLGCVGMFDNFKDAEYRGVSGKIKHYIISAKS